MNILATVLSLIALILTQASVSTYQENLEKIEGVKEKINQAEVKLAEQKKENLSKSLRQKARNEDLSVEIDEFKVNSAEIQEKLSRTKEQIKEIEDSIGRVKAELDSSEERKNLAQQELQTQQDEVQALRNEIPRIEQQIETKRFEIGDFENQANDLAERLSVFSNITTVLRQHYLDTVSSIRKYARERPWLEPGEELSIQLGPVDLASGYIAISEGGATGLRENMIFAVHAAGEEISKIRIKKVFRTYSLAELIPLVGNPLKLQSVKEVDLLAL